MITIIKRAYHVLGIESSCDDTGVAIIKDDGSILSNCINSQLSQHLSHGGIIPILAREYHLKNIDRVANEAFKKSCLNSVKDDIAAIAVASRPGLELSLKIGLNYAKKLALKYTKPIIPIHHMQAHALMPLLENRHIKFPFISLLISGGHCLLAIAKRYNQFHILGTTLDIAPGELLDKIARRLKLRNLGNPYDRISGGAAIELLANQSGVNRFKYFVGRNTANVPMLTNISCDFSFSGYFANLKMVEEGVDKLWLGGNREALMSELGHICGSMQRIILIQLVKKLQRAILFYKMFWRYTYNDAFADETNCRHLGYQLRTLDPCDSIDVVISGGVAANSYFVNGLKLACQECIDESIQVHCPSKQLCSDNGLMIAWNGLLRYKHFLSNKDEFGNLNIEDDILLQLSRLDLLNEVGSSPIGADITQSVRLANFKLPQLNHAEFKVTK